MPGPNLRVLLLRYSHRQLSDGCTRLRVDVVGREHRLDRAYLRGELFNPGLLDFERGLLRLDLVGLLPDQLLLFLGGFDQQRSQLGVVHALGILAVVFVLN